MLRARRATINEKPNQQREMHQRSTQKTRTNKQERKVNTIFNEVRQFAYVFGARERDFIDSTINYKFLPVTIHEGPSPLFIARESQRLRKLQLDSSSDQK